ncbi:hypothetical protein AURDEDRAFT_185228 [Auricularia subglabra TFB-10046 SS5]|nr:hypothetical protein AURDEDRAFT_185228 [Auricularia subglabra TFB-10046 SS5]
MPLRPATFTPYPAQDRRAAARERYYRALEEARRAKEAYADALDGEDDGDCEPKPTDGKELSPPPPPVPVSKARAERQHESEAATASSSTAASAQTASPIPESPVASKTASVGASGGTASAFQQWFRANMGVPSPFTTEAPPAPAPPADSITNVSSVLRPHMVQERTLFDSSDRDRRRAALTVAELASPEPSIDSSPSPTSRTINLYQPPDFVVPQRSVPPKTRVHPRDTDDAPELRPSPQPPTPAPTLRSLPPISALATLASAAAVTLAVPVPPRPAPVAPSVPATPIPDLALAPVEAPVPKQRLPSPTPQHIPIFAECPPPPADKPVDPLTEIKRLAATFDQLKRAFVFPAVLDFSSMPPPLMPAPGKKADDEVKLPVCARNLPVHAYEHALQKILTRLESVTAARAKGVRDARKKAVADVKGEMERIREEVRRRASVR